MSENVRNMQISDTATHPWMTYQTSNMEKDTGLVRGKGAPHAQQSILACSVSLPLLSSDIRQPVLIHDGAASHAARTATAYVLALSTITSSPCAETRRCTELWRHVGLLNTLDWAARCELQSGCQLWTDYSLNALPHTGTALWNIV